MPTTYERCDDSVRAILNRLLDKRFPELKQAGLTVCLLFASSEDGNPLKHGGYPAAAIAEKNSLKKRAAGLEDVTITIDAIRWGDMSDRQREALIFHETMHFELKHTKEGQLKRDALGRPEVRLRLHDFQIGGFNEVVRSYGADAIEREAIIDVVTKWKQAKLWDAWG